jgi:hypothetical protein
LDCVGKSRFTNAPEKNPDAGEHRIRAKDGDVNLPHGSQPDLYEHPDAKSSGSLPAEIDRRQCLSFPVMARIVSNSF